MQTDTLFEKCSGFFGIGRGYTAMTTIVLDREDSLIEKWKVARDDLLAWSTKRGAKREGIEILFFTRPERFSEIHEHLFGISTSDHAISPLFREFPPDIAFMTEDGPSGPQCQPLSTHLGAGTLHLGQCKAA